MLSIGQTVYLPPTGNNVRYSRPNELRPAKIKKVGRKYAYASIHGWDEIKIDIATMTCNTSNNGGYKVYLSEEQFQQEQRHQELYKDLRWYFSNYNTKIPPLEILEQVHALMEPYFTN